MRGKKKNPVVISPEERKPCSSFLGKKRKAPSKGGREKKTGQFLGEKAGGRFSGKGALGEKNGERRGRSPQGKKQRDTTRHLLTTQRRRLVFNYHDGKGGGDREVSSLLFSEKRGGPA